MKVHHLAVERDQPTEGDEDDRSDATGQDADRYPAGMRIHVDHDTMKAMKLKENPEPGSKHHVEGTMHIVEAHEPLEGEEHRGFTAHFTHMGMEPEEPEGKEEGLRDTVKKAMDTAKPREDKTTRAQDRGRDAGKRDGSAVEPKRA
jgi:hypothetical protein